MAHGRPKVSINLLLIVIGLICFAVPVVWFLFLAERGIKAIQHPAEQADRLKRTVSGQEQKPDPTLSSDEQAVLAIAAGVAIDREGEKPECVEEVYDGLIDAYIRLKSRYKKTSYEDLVTKSVIWLPPDWKYPWYWRDRPINWITSGRETTIERLKPIVRERLKNGPGPGCADRIQRAGFHLGGKLAGEGEARERVSRLPGDPRWRGKSCLTKFHCVAQ